MYLFKCTYIYFLLSLTLCSESEIEFYRVFWYLVNILYHIDILL